MNTKVLAKFIFVEKAQNDKYSIKYPTVIFPNKCIACGKPRETANELDLFAAKTVAWSRTISADTIKTVGVNMKMAVPLCNEHKAQIDEHKTREKQEQRKLILSVVVTAILGALVMAAVFFGIYHTGLIGGGIFLSILFGAPLGILFFWPVWHYLPALIRVIQKKRPYFYKDPYIAPYNIYLLNDENYVSMRLILGIENDQIRNEFKTLNRVEEHLIAAMDYKNDTACVNAIKTLSQAQCESAVPAILNKCLATMGQNYKICNAAIDALKGLGIPEPLDAKVVEQLMEGLNNSNARGATIRVLSLTSIEHLLTALDNPDAGVRATVINALAETRKEAAVPALIGRLSDTQKYWGSRVCDNAARALKIIGTPEALAAVEKWKTKTQE